MWQRVVWRGLASGAVGAAVMTIGEKLEQPPLPRTHVTGA